MENAHHSLTWAVSLTKQVPVQMAHYSFSEKPTGPKSERQEGVTT